MKLKQIFFYSICFVGVMQGQAFPPDISFSNNVGMDFGTIEAGGLLGGAVTVDIDGDVTYTGDLSGDGVGVAGQVRLDPLNNADEADISCSSSLVLCNASGDSLTVTDIEVAVGNSNSPTSCAGVGNVIDNVAMVRQTFRRMLYFGATLNVPGNASYGGVYSTGLTCGVPLTIEAIVP